MSEIEHFLVRWSGDDISDSWAGLVNPNKQSSNVDKKLKSLEKSKKFKFADFSKDFCDVSCPKTVDIPKMKRLKIIKNWYFTR